MGFLMVREIPTPVRNCDEVSKQEWVNERFDKRCYFYPGRDCPGYKRGQKCARIREVIPSDSLGTKE